MSLPIFWLEKIHIASCNNFQIEGFAKLVSLGFGYAGAELHKQVGIGNKPYQLFQCVFLVRKDKQSGKVLFENIRKGQGFIIMNI